MAWKAAPPRDFKQLLERLRKETMDADPSGMGCALRRACVRDHACVRRHGAGGRKSEAARPAARGAGVAAARSTARRCWTRRACATGPRQTRVRPANAAGCARSWRPTACRCCSRIAPARASARRMRAGAAFAQACSKRRCVPPASRRRTCWPGSARRSDRAPTRSATRCAGHSSSEMLAATSAFMPSRRAGHWLLDLYAVARQRLAAAGVKEISGGEILHACRGGQLLLLSPRRAR